MQQLVARATPFRMDGHGRGGADQSGGLGSDPRNVVRSGKTVVLEPEGA